MKPEYADVYGPFAIAITSSWKKKLTAFNVVGRVPREISRFCRYFINCVGLLEGRVRDVEVQEVSCNDRWNENPNHDDLI